MLSIILYGRNDNYGYNVHKRAAISLNCFAEILTHPGDEILFVDCNTPDELPTFPEAIRDTLTSKARDLLRIFRLRPEVYYRIKGESHLNALEPISRNIAIRRMNPENRWVLSTNTDMVFVPRKEGRSLSDIIADAQDGFYELPRFEVPEVLWETVDRLDPLEVIRRFGHWGKRLHLNEIVYGQPQNVYDAPGDFQLVLREHINYVCGFNEAMKLGWHVDSNLCKRMNLLLGKTSTLVDELFAYHCDHTRLTTPMHCANKKENDQYDFIHEVKEPRLEAQANDWGLPDEPVEEIRLSEEHGSRYERTLEELLPGATADFTVSEYSENAYNHSFYYKFEHTFPYVADNIVTVSPMSRIAYYGINSRMLENLAAFRKKIGHSAGVEYSRSILPNAPESLAADAGKPSEHLSKSADLLLFDFGLHGFPGMKNKAGYEVPKPEIPTARYIVEMMKSLYKAVLFEHERIRENMLPRKFILVGITNTLVEAAISKVIGLLPVPYGCYFKHGNLLPSPEIETFAVAVRCMGTLDIFTDYSIEMRCKIMSQRLGYTVDEGMFLDSDKRLVAMEKAIPETENIARYARKILDMGLCERDLALMRIHANFSLSQGMADRAAVQMEMHDLWFKILKGEISPESTTAINQVPTEC